MSDSPLPRLPKRKPESHKGHYGRGLLVGGSQGMTGAIALAGIAALRSGAGLVNLAVPDVCLATVAATEPSYTTTPLASDDAGRISESAGRILLDLASKSTAVACGPGLGRSSGLSALMAKVYTHLKEPTVIDADGLNALAESPEVLEKPGGPRILTPHVGEFSRLVGRSHVNLEQCNSMAVELAAHWGVVIVMKSHRTLITDGKQSFTNTRGNPGMATGGSGDVLTGVITALLCQGLAPLDAARLGVHVHGLAGDLAAEDVGQVSLMASDLLEYLPAAFQELAMDD